MTRERALEIVGAYGADVARWPADERAAVLALAVGDAELRAAMDAARGLDAMLAGWAGDVPAKRFEVDVPERALPVRRGVLRWAGGAAVAASLALVVILMPGGQPQMVAGDDGISLGSASDMAEPDDGFAMIFTPTADEEELI